MARTRKVLFLTAIGLAACAAHRGGRGGDDDDDGEQQEDCGCDGPIEEGGPEVHFACGEQFCHEDRTWQCDDDGHATLLADGCGVECLPAAELCDGIDNDCDGLIDDGVRDEGGLCIGETTCEDRTRWIYVVTQEDELVRFEPDQLELSVVGRIECGDAPAGYRPFSMAVDREGWAWVLFVDMDSAAPGRLFRVSVADASCEPTAFEPGQQGFSKFGMGFVSDESGSDDETLFVAGGEELRVDQRLGWVAMDDLAVTPVGDLPGSPELTGTGAGELWGFFPDLPVATVARLDRETATMEVTFPLDDVSSGDTVAWAFAFWGGRFYVFLETARDQSSRIYGVDPATGDVAIEVDETDHTIVGAGVSTCAPVELI